MKGSGVSGNYYELQTGDEYWVSGIKVNGEDRHWAGGGKVFIDNVAVDKYLEITGSKSLPNNLVPTELKLSKASAEQHEYENERLDEEAEPVLGRRSITKTVNRLKE